MPCPISGLFRTVGTDLAVFPINNASSTHIFFFFLFFSELGTEPRALRILGKRSTTELNPQPHNF